MVLVVCTLGRTLRESPARREDKVHGEESYFSLTPERFSVFSSTLDPVES